MKVKYLMPKGFSRRRLSVAATGLLALAALSGAVWYSFSPNPPPQLWGVDGTTWRTYAKNVEGDGPTKDQPVYIEAQAERIIGLRIGTPVRVRYIIKMADSMKPPLFDALMKGILGRYKTPWRVVALPGPPSFEHKDGINTWQIILTVATWEPPSVEGAEEGKHIDFIGPPNEDKEKAPATTAASPEAAAANAARTAGNAPTAIAAMAAAAANNAAKAASSSPTVNGPATPENEPISKTSGQATAANGPIAAGQPPAPTGAMPPAGNSAQAKPAAEDGPQEPRLWPFKVEFPVFTGDPPRWQYVRTPPINFGFSSLLEPDADKHGLDFGPMADIPDRPNPVGTGIVRLGYGIVSGGVIYMVVLFVAWLRRRKQPVPVPAEVVSLRQALENAERTRRARSHVVQVRIAIREYLGGATLTDEELIELWTDHPEHETVTALLGILSRAATLGRLDRSDEEEVMYGLNRLIESRLRQDTPVTRWSRFRTAVGTSRIGRTARIVGRPVGKLPGLIASEKVVRPVRLALRLPLKLLKRQRRRKS